MDGYATLRQLLTAPAGTVFRERRPTGLPRVDGAELRALPDWKQPAPEVSRWTPDEMRERIDALEACAWKEQP
jgi:hypothetical protein